MPADDPTYAFDNARPGQRDRLRTLEELWDPGTIRHLDALGIQPGWRCLEVGAGGGSIAAWLCDRAGSVVATDLDTTFLDELDRPNLEARVHDVLTDDLPEGEFDLVHCRLVLAWLPEPHAALARLVAALKPGGWLLAEEMDFVSSVPDPRMDEVSQACVARVMEAHHAVLTSRHDFDIAYGRRVTGDLEDAGLESVDADGRVSMWRGGQAGGRVWRLTLVQIREALIESGLATAADVDHVIALCDDPALSCVSPIVMAAWGRRPPG